MSLSDTSSLSTQTEEMLLTAKEEEKEESQSAKVSASTTNAANELETNTSEPLSEPESEEDMTLPADALIQDAPIFRPSFEEFKDFSTYVNSLYHKCPTGICKIVPPPEWTNSLPKFNKSFNKKQMTPMKQEIVNNGNKFHLLNLIPSQPTSIEQFKKYAQKFDPPDVQNVEEQIWKDIQEGTQPALYGSDLEGSLFRTMIDDVPIWNLSNLETILNAVDDPIPGVNLPMMYIGMYKSIFAWHVEDMDLFSVSFLHHGAPKTWYGVHSDYGKKLERIVKRHYGEHYAKCPAFLRHKVVLFNPSLLAKHRIPYVKAVQQPGEFMITFPYAYHCGFNNGYNMAEAVNFGLEAWIPFGKKAVLCRCTPATVVIDMNEFQKKYDAWKQGERVDCICKDNKNYGQLMVGCDKCLCWVHGKCVGILKEKEVPEHYLCPKCSPFEDEVTVRRLESSTRKRAKQEPEELVRKIPKVESVEATLLS